jgi:hypothetical protein
MTMIEIARFADVYEAEIAASRLRAEGYDVVLGGAEHVKANPLVLMALGGVNLSAPRDQADAVRRLLERLRGGAERIDEVETGPVEAARRTWPLVLLAAIGFGILVGLAGWGDAPRPPEPPNPWF